ncbi:uncharacterized protein LOC142338602 [Convolutriloba macropyga]|uniref:uncharacterized protein LOC142338602 n=1 Tax=Convolutriloba macropyga TaxID=536237 RepID=UPI003F51F1D7
MSIKKATNSKTRNLSTTSSPFNPRKNTAHLKQQVHVFVLTVFLYCVSLVIGQSEGRLDNRCPVVTPVHVNEKLFVNKRWYQIWTGDGQPHLAYRPSVDPLTERKCTFIDQVFKQDKIGWYIEVNETSYINNKYVTERFIARQPPSHERTSWGKFVIEPVNKQKHSWSLFPYKSSVSKTRLLVYLDSDFAVLYSCTETVPYKMESVWVLASRREYSRDTFYYSIEPRLKRKGINVRMEPVDHLRCPMEPMEEECMRLMDIHERGRERMYIECLSKFSDTKYADIDYCLRQYHG